MKKNPVKAWRVFMFCIQFAVCRGQSSRSRSFAEAEGDPILLNVCGNQVLVTGTSVGYSKMLDLSRR